MVKIKNKKRSLSTGLIITVFVVLLLVGATLGTVFYADSGQRFIGSIVTPTDTTEDTTRKVTEPQCTDAGEILDTFITVTGQQVTNCVCDDANNFIQDPDATIAPDPDTGYVRADCTCKSGYELSEDGTTCVRPQVECPAGLTEVTTISVTGAPTTKCQCTSLQYYQEATEICVDITCDLTIEDAKAATTKFPQYLDPATAGLLDSFINNGDAWQAFVADNCPAVDEACISLEITEPTDTGSMSIDDDFSGEALKVVVMGPEGVDQYQFASAGTIWFNDPNDDTQTELFTTDTEVTLYGGPAEGDTEMLTVTGYLGSSPLTICADSLEITREELPTTPGLCSLEITSPSEADASGEPTFTIGSDGFDNELLEISVQNGSGSYKYESLNGTITFDNNQSGYTTSDTQVLMNGGPTAGNDDTVIVSSIFATADVPDCSDSFTVEVELPEIPIIEEPPPEIPPTEQPPLPPPLVIPPTEEPSPPPPSVEEPPPLVIPPAEEPSPPPSAPPAEKPLLKAAAPEVPSSGPGLLIYLVAAGLGGAYIKRKRRK